MMKPTNTPIGDGSTVNKPRRLLRLTVLGLIFLVPAYALSIFQKPLRRTPLVTPAFDDATLTRLQASVLDNLQALLEARDLQ